MSVAVVGLALYHNAWLVPAAAWHSADVAAAYLLHEILFAAEEHFEVFVQTATAIKAGIYYYTFLVVIFTEDVAIDVAER